MTVSIDKINREYTVETITAMDIYLVIPNQQQYSDEVLSQILIN